MNPTTTKLASLLGTASFLTLATALAAQGQQVAQAQMAQAQPESAPEQVLVTGSLIRGTVAVGVPVINLGLMDFKTTGAITTSDLFRNIPAFNVKVGQGAGTLGAGRAGGGARVNLRQLDSNSAPRNLMMIDGMRYPAQDQGLCSIEPDIIPVAAIERVDLLLDGASATYGSDAIGGVFNIILRRAYDGAITMAGYKTSAGGRNQYFASQLWGRTWDGGNITLSYEWRDTTPTKGNFNSRYSFDFSPWGLDDRTPLGSSIPGIVSTGALVTANSAYPASAGHNCTNCYAIPQGTGSDFNASLNGGIGPLARFSGSTLSWAQLNTPANSGTNGTRNEFNPYRNTDYAAALQFSGGAVTFDQRLTKDISFYGEGFYGLRRATLLQQLVGNMLGSFPVPTLNPYYPSSTAGVCTTNPSIALPAGIPAGCVPNNLRMNYHMSVEKPVRNSGGELAQRYQGGLNIDLPAEWAAQLSYSMTRDSNWVHNTNRINKGMVSAALGWTLAAAPAVGADPSSGTWAKPSTVPYLNLFCDPTQFQCNSQQTLDYIEDVNRVDEAFWINEKSIKADGPLFDLPGGSVKAAIGASYISNRFIVTTTTQNPTNDLVVAPQDPQGRQIWATYAQLNLPVFSEQNAIFGFRRLDFEASWRHDQYSDFGGTSNQKVGFNWSPVDDVTIRGGYGTSFRAPAFGENSLLVNAVWNGFGLPADVFVNNNTVRLNCVGGAPTPGSGGAKLFNAGIPGLACGSTQGGMVLNGGAKGPVDSGWRNYVNQDGQVLKPEQSLNWALGFDYAPTNFLSGLNVQATWYSIKITGLLANFGNPSSTSFNDGALGFAFVVPSDLRNTPVGDPAHIDGIPDGAPLCAGMNSTPQLCAPFQDMIRKAFSMPGNTVPATAQTLIYWLNDGGIFNRGWQKNEGIDYEISYDWDMGNWGAFNVGTAGAYTLHVWTVKIPGAAGDAGKQVDGYHRDLDAIGNVQQLGVVSPPPQPLPQHRSRSRIGWSKGQWDATLFMNYDGHFYHTQSAPPNVNGQCLATDNTKGGGSSPCAIEGYSNVEPSYYTFDLSIGYDTGEDPANDYLKNVSIQLTVDNVMDRHPAFEYRNSTGGGQPSPFDIEKNLFGRVVGVRLTKTW